MGITAILAASSNREDLTALSRSQAMIWFKPDGSVLDANSNFCEALGYSAQEIIGQHHRIFCPKSLIASVDYANFWGDLASGSFKQGQFERVKKDGSPIWIEATYNPVLRGGKVVRVLKIATDITTSKVRAVEDGDRVAAVDKSQAIIEFAPSGNVLSANQNFLGAMGYGLTDIVGRHHGMFCDPEYVRTEDYTQFWQRLRGGEFIAGNFVRLGRGGRKVWIQAAYTPVFDGDGNVYKVIKVATDITARMEAVDRIGRAITSLSQGDLTAEIAEHVDSALEKTRDDFNAALRSLRNTVTAIRESAETLAANANVIGSVSDQIARGAEAQAASVEQTAAALEQITTLVRDTSQRAGEAGVLVSSTRQSAEASGTIVNNATAAMHEIEASSREIENITGVIDEIAFQTNLLALNAGVEAARAGEAGKGFAVVAQEVRELAQRSAAAAKNIKGLIATAGTSVRNGVGLVTSTGDALSEIVRRVQSVDQNVQQISVAAKEQAQGVAEINGAINSLDQATQRNASTVEEANAAAQSLAAEAGRLFDLINGFKLADGDFDGRRERTQLKLVAR